MFQGGRGGGLDVGGLIRSRAAVRWVWVWVWVLAWIRMEREERRGRDEDDEREKRRMDCRRRRGVVEMALAMAWDGSRDSRLNVE